MPKSTCSVPGCNRTRRKREWCEAHYTRWMKHGDVMADIPIRARRPTLSQIAPLFWSRVEKGAACWEWQRGCDGDGYGAMKVSGRQWGAHRLAWTLTHGPIPEGMFVCHTCDNPPCCNPGHLFLASSAGNVADRVQKDRSARQRGSVHGMAKLTEADVREIRRERDSGVLLKDLAERFGITVGCVHLIATNQTWAHVR